MTKIKVVVADGDRQFCNGLKEFFLGDEQVEVLACAASGVETLEKVQRYQPDVLITDLILPGLDGFEVMGRVKKLTVARKPKVMVISRLFSPVLRKETTYSVPSKASSTFSLHSTAQMPPRSR